MLKSARATWGRRIDEPRRECDVSVEISSGAIGPVGIVFPVVDTPGDASAVMSGMHGWNEPDREACSG